MVQPEVAQVLLIQRVEQLVEGISSIFSGCMPVKVTLFDVLALAGELFPAHLEQLLVIGRKHPLFVALSIFDQVHR